MVQPQRLYVVMYAIGGDWVRLGGAHDHYELAVREREILRAETKDNGCGGEYRIFAWVPDPEWVIS